MSETVGLRVLLALCCLLLFSTLFNIFPSPPGTNAASPGVAIGQWAHYNVSGNESGQVVDSLFTIRNVDGTNVSFTNTDTFLDGHTSTDILSVDINTGPKDPSSGWYFVITPNKGLGQTLYPINYHFDRLPIQDVTVRPYASASRQTSHVQARNSSIVYPSSNNVTTTEDYYWDSSSGMFTEILKKVNGTEILHIVMSSTSIWQPDSHFDALIVPSAILTVASAGLIAVLLVGRYRKRRR